MVIRCAAGTTTTRVFPGSQPHTSMSRCKSSGSSSCCIGIRDERIAAPVVSGQPVDSLLREPGSSTLALRRVSQSFSYRITDHLSAVRAHPRTTDELPVLPLVQALHFVSAIFVLTDSMLDVHEDVYNFETEKALDGAGFPAPT